MTVSTAIMRTIVESDTAPPDARAGRRRPSDDPRLDAVADGAHLPFETLLTVTQRVAITGRGHSTDHQAAAQMYEAPASQVGARSRGTESPDGRSAAKSSHRTRAHGQAAESGARPSRSGSAGGRAPNGTVGSGVTSAGAEIRPGGSSSDLQPNRVLVGSDSPAARNGSNVASSFESPRSGEASRAGAQANGPSPTAGMPPIAATSAGNEGLRSTPAQQIGRILGGSRVEAAESPRAIEADGNTGGAPPSRSDARAAKQPASADEADPKRESPSSSAGEKADAARRSTPFDELVRSIRLNAGHRHSSARLQLEPKELGRLDVEVRMVGDDAEITVRTETPAARLLVRERGAELTAALERHGIHVERFEVTSGPPGDGAYAFASGDGSQESRADRGRDGAQPPRDRATVAATHDVHASPGPESGIIADRKTSVAGTARRLDIRV